ncbi:MAG: C_GCAxxG_C_C family protein [Dehalococcoidia bacterium]|nr:MAG: C_GCAxxG_C_C family protein [Dehalococcoidia bacterium]
MAESTKGVNKAILDKVEKRAYELIDKYHGCSQCSLFAIQEVCGMRDDVMAKASIGLAGGVGSMRSACGALTGSALALGMKYGRDVSALEGPAEEAIEIEYAALEPVAKLAKWFEREFGSIICRDIRRAFMGTELIREIPWQKQWLQELGIHEHCSKIVAKTARRAAAMLENPDLSILDKV